MKNESSFRFTIDDTNKTHTITIEDYSGKNYQEIKEDKIKRIKFFGTNMAFIKPRAK